MEKDNMEVKEIDYEKMVDDASHRHLSCFTSSKKS